MGRRGKARILAVDTSSIALEFTWHTEPTVPDPIMLVVGLPRPQSARRVLHDAAALGAREIAFVETERSDPNYRQSFLWHSGEWRRHLIAGAQQAFDTYIPKVSWEHTLATVVSNVPNASIRLAFDNYEAIASMKIALQSVAQVPGQRERTLDFVLAFGPERGWSTGDRDILRSSGFALVSLGRRVLKDETAIVTSLAILRSEMGWS